MMPRDPRLLVQPAPLLKRPMNTGQAMLDVSLALLPATLAGLWFFGLGALLVLLACMLGALATEWLDAEPLARRAGGRVDAVEPSPHDAAKAYIAVLRFWHHLGIAESRSD